MSGRKRVAAALLRAAAKDIEDFGWIQFRAGDEDRGFCMVGGIHHASHRTGAKFGDRTLAYQAINTVLGRYSYQSVADWNDTAGRTKDQVVSIMRKTANALEHGLKV